LKPRADSYYVWICRAVLRGTYTRYLSMEQHQVRGTEPPSHASHICYASLLFIAGWIFVFTAIFYAGWCLQLNLCMSYRFHSFYLSCACGVVFGFVVTECLPVVSIFNISLTCLVYGGTFSNHFSANIENGQYLAAVQKTVWCLGFLTQYIVLHCLWSSSLLRVGRQTDTTTQLNDINPWWYVWICLVSSVSLLVICSWLLTGAYVYRLFLLFD